MQAGTRLGHYEIIEPLGAGGMGEVYRARDTNLKREVAIKVLPEAVAADQERLARLQREAHLLAALNHANIASIHSLERDADTWFLVLELVQGETLAERLKRGSLPVQEALEAAKQIAKALEAAHEKGIIHRDLKPANVMLTPGGNIKVLDFGLAKAFEVKGAEGDLTHCPTMITVAGTRTGVIMGTAAYMSPEQAKGRQLDERTDVWSFGCVLYEMLTARSAFGAEDAAETLAAILKGEPDWSALPDGTPKGLHRVLRRTLRTDPDMRLHDIADARIEIEETLSSPDEGETASTFFTAVPTRQRVLPWAVAAAMGVLAATILIAAWRSQTAPSNGQWAAHLEVLLPSGVHLAVETLHPVLDLSPDGSRLVFVGRQGGENRLYIRDLADASGQSRVIANTEGAASPFFSLDGDWIGYFDGTVLKKVPASGGSPVHVFRVTTPSVNRGATWGVNDEVVYAPSTNSGLWRGSVEGNTERSFQQWFSITDPTEPFAWPDALPSGDRFLFTDWRREQPRVALLSLEEDGEIVSLINGATRPRYSPTGHILFARGGSLWVAPFDLESKSIGSEQELLNGLMGHPDTGAAQFAVAGNRALAYVSGDSSPEERELVWVDREGNATAIPLGGGSRFFDPRLSPDGTQLAMTRSDGPNYDVWTVDLTRAPGLQRRTTHPGEDFAPVWSPDGLQIAIGSEIGEDDGELGPGLALITGASDRTERLLETPASGNWEFPSSWSPNGEYLAYTAARGAGQTDLYVLHMDDREAEPLLETPFNEKTPMFSPDGLWIAYVSDISGQDQVYVQAFPEGDPISISTDGGVEPLWARSGRELFYRGPAGVMGVELGDGERLAPGDPKVLFEDRFVRAEWGTFGGNYDVSRDGRFVMVRRKNATTPTVIRVVLNWLEVFQVAGLE